MNIFPDETPLVLHFPSSQRLNDGNWNNLIITWKSSDGAYSLIWNAVRIYADTGYGKGKTVNIKFVFAIFIIVYENLKEINAKEDKKKE